MSPQQHGLLLIADKRHIAYFHCFPAKSHRAASKHYHYLITRGLICGWLQWATTSELRGHQITTRGRCARSQETNRCAKTQWSSWDTVPWGSSLLENLGMETIRTDVSIADKSPSGHQHIHTDVLGFGEDYMFCLLLQRGGVQQQTSRVEVVIESCNVRLSPQYIWKCRNQFYTALS